MLAEHAFTMTGTRIVIVDDEPDPCGRLGVAACARPQHRFRALAADDEGPCAKPIEAPLLLQAIHDVLALS
jgi:hypothetical protein